MIGGHYVDSSPLEVEQMRWEDDGGPAFRAPAIVWCAGPRPATPFVEVDESVSSGGRGSAALPFS